VIRTATSDDALALADVQVASWHAAYREFLPDDILATFTVALREAAWQRILATPRPEQPTRVFVREGQVVAFASVGPSRDEPGVGEVWALYAPPDAFGTGAGRALLSDVLGFLATTGFETVMLWVVDGNARAIRFYEAGGFRLDGGAKEELGMLHRRMRRIAVAPRVRQHGSMCRSRWTTSPPRHRSTCSAGYSLRRTTPSSSGLIYRAHRLPAQLGRLS
jgi:GNAT superfamily N-acetyltransferase